MVTRGRNAKNQSVALNGEAERRRRARGPVRGAGPSSPRKSVPGEAVPDGGVVLTAEQQKRRRARSIAIALVLGFLAVLFYVVTIVKLGPGVLIRPL